MPVVRVDYNETLLQNEQIHELVDRLLQVSMGVYSCGEDKVSIFTAAYGKYYFSTAAAEIEIRVKTAVYENADKPRDALRQEHLAEYRHFVEDFMAKHALPKGITLAITFENWEVSWMPKND